MSKFIYLTAIPEALIVSMLPPEEFGEYLSTGDEKNEQRPGDILRSRP
jgi:hypothetical protein